jgi:hypothetical protein
LIIFHPLIVPAVALITCAVLFTVNDLKELLSCSVGIVYCILCFDIVLIIIVAVPEPSVEALTLINPPPEPVPTKYPFDEVLLVTISFPVTFTFRGT